MPRFLGGRNFFKRGENKAIGFSFGSGKGEKATIFQGRLLGLFVQKAFADGEPHNGNQQIIW